MNGKILILMLCMILLVGAVSAEVFTFDNVKQYDEVTKTVTIVNTFNLGREISTIQLKTPLVYVVPVGYQKVWEYEIDLFDDTYTDAFGKIELIDLKTGEVIERQLDYKYLATELIEVNDYGLVCSEDLKNLNGTNCNLKVIGTHQEERKVWKDFDTKTLIKGKVIIGIFTYVYEYDNIEWIPTLFGKKINEWASFVQSSGTQTFIDIGGLNYTVQTFTSNGTFNWTGSGSLNVSVLVVAGGGGGGGIGDNGGGGGAGGLIFNNAFDVSGDISVVVGSGGDGGDGEPPFSDGNNGANSSFDSLIAVGGGGGGGAGAFGLDGGSGGGGGGENQINLGGSGIVGQGNDGGSNRANAPYSTGGGGGAGAVGFDGDSGSPSVGGVGLQFNITGTLTYYAGGGGGAQVGAGTNDGGLGGGGDGGTTATDGTANTGGGGGGALDGFVGKAGGSGIIVVRYLTSDVEVQTPTVTLNSPIDFFNSTNNIITFNGTISIFIPLNVSLIIDDVYNETNTSGILGDYFFTKTLPDGVHSWTYEACSVGGCTNATARTFLIDTINPIINLVSPLNNSIIISTTATYNVSLNATITDTNLDTCWYNNETDNITVTCGDNATIELGEGYHTLIWYANDTFGHEVSNSTTFLINYIRYNVTFTDPIVEGETDLIVFNLTATNIDNLVSILEYNNTNYTMAGTSNSTYGEFNYTITAPTVPTTTEIPLKVYYTLNSLNYTSIDYNQTVYFIDPIEVAETCSAGLSAAMYFNFKDAQNLTTLSNVSINYNFKMGVSDTSQKITIGNLTSNEFYLCINSTVYNNYTLGYGEIHYEKDGWSARRWYAFNTQRLSNTTVNNSLYLLGSSSSTSFLITIQKPTLTPYQNIYTSLLRWYPALDEYKIVEMGKTDNKGQTVKKIEVEDTDYRIGIYEQDGTLIYLASPIRMVCIASPCTYTLTVISISGVAYSDFLGVEGELIHSEGIFLYTYNDPSQTTSLIYLNVSRISGNNEILLCQDSSSGFTGVLTCNVTGQQGLLKGIVYRSASPSKALAVLWIDGQSTVFQSKIGLFFVMIMVLTLFLIGIYYPVASILLGILALIPALFLKVITYPILIGIAVLAGIVLHFMRETR